MLIPGYLSSIYLNVQQKPTKIIKWVQYFPHNSMKSMKQHLDVHVVNKKLQKIQIIETALRFSFCCLVKISCIWEFGHHIKSPSSVCGRESIYCFLCRPHFSIISGIGLVIICFHLFGTRAPVTVHSVTLQGPEDRWCDCQSSEP